MLPACYCETKSWFSSLFPWKGSIEQLWNFGTRWYNTSRRRMSELDPVNLCNPSLTSELIFPQEHTLIGSDNSQDIQLCGMGILPEHCIIDITPEGQVMLTPQKNTRWRNKMQPQLFDTCHFTQYFIINGAQRYLENKLLYLLRSKKNSAFTF